MVMQITQHSFEPRDLVAGNVVLDLVNTVTARNTSPIDWLDGYPRVLEWARLSRAFDEQVLRQLDRIQPAHPVQSRSALRRLRDLREALLEAFTAKIQQRDPSPAALSRIEQDWKAAVAHAELRRETDRVIPTLSVARSGLEYIRYELALKGVELLDSAPVDRTRVCPGDHCGWLFVDRSRGGQRRWCDMATCGNLAKTRRHYELHRRPNASPGKRLT